MGIPLNRIKDIRLLYMADMFDDNSINFDNPDFPPVAKGHVIAARITSENPDEVRLTFQSVIEILIFSIGGVITP